MAASKLHIFFLLSLFYALIFTPIEADNTADEIVIGSDDTEVFRVELDKLNSKIPSLESLIDKRNEELKSKKEKAIAEKEKTVKEKSDSITLLRNEVASLEVKGSLDAHEQVKKAHTRACELENQVEKLQMEIEFQNRLMETLETRAKELEKKILDVNPKLHDLEQVVDEQKTKLHKTERALKIAEGELKKAKFEATLEVKDLTESYVDTHWREHGKPAYESFMQKALEKKALAEKWVEPHLQTIKTKWVPAARGKWVLIMTEVEPHLQSLTKRTAEVYVQSKETLTPYMSKIKEVVDPRFQKWVPAARGKWVLIMTEVEPHLQSLTKRTTEVYVQSKETLTPYMSKIKEVVDPRFQKWVPAARGKWVLIMTEVEPHLQSLTKRTTEVYVQSKETLTPYMSKIKEVVDPRFQKWVPAARGKWVLIMTEVEPHLQSLTKWTTEVYVQLKETLTPYMSKIKEVVDPRFQKWVPAARGKWVLIMTEVEPHLQSLTKRTAEVYVQSKETLTPYMSKIKEVVDPRFQKWVPAARGKWVLIMTEVEPHLQSLTKRTAEVYVQSKETLTPYMSKIKEVVDPHFQKWVPAARGKWVLIITEIEPHLQSLTKRTTEVYVQSKETLTPFMSKIKEVVDPRFQGAKKFCKPYIDDIATATRPHLNKARETLRPYMKVVVQAYSKFLESTT